MTEKTMPGKPTIPTVFHQPAVLSSLEEEKKHLENAMRSVQQFAFSMKRALDRNYLHEALKCATLLLAELRTSLLSPPLYYELWIKVGDHLTFLEQYFTEEVQRGRRVEELYEMVQHAGNIVPRLYLLITVGSVYIKSKSAPAKDILKDLVEMCKGVQHPTRGLFLRHYLSQMAKGKLPDSGNEYEGPGGTVNDSIDFILQNYHEMVRLWVRLERRADKQTRKQLCDLVGTNLQRLAQLQGVDAESYASYVFPKLLEVVVQSQDVVAQQYLMTTVVAVFPDEFHLATLGVFLQACGMLQPGVDVTSVLTALIDRLGLYVANPEMQRRRSPEEAAAVDGMLDLFLQASFLLVKQRNVLGASGFVEVAQALAVMTMRTSPDDVKRLNNVVNAVTAAFDPQLADGPRLLLEDAEVNRKVRRLLMFPVDALGGVVPALQVSACAALHALLAFRPRRLVSLDWARKAIDGEGSVSTLEQCVELFDMVRPLVVDEDGAPSYDERYADDEDFEEEQHLAVRMLRLLDAPQPEVQLKMLQHVRKLFGLVGEDQRRLPHTLPPLIFAYLRLLGHPMLLSEPATYQRLVDRALENVTKTNSVLAPLAPHMAYNLHLETALAADRHGRDGVAYTALTSGFELLEEHISKPSARNAALTAMIATLQSMRRLKPDDHSTAAQQAWRCANGLLKKSDKARLAGLCTFLFVRHTPDAAAGVGGASGAAVGAAAAAAAAATPSVGSGVVGGAPATIVDGDEANQGYQCLRRALKLVDQCPSGQQTGLYLELGNLFIWFFERGLPKVSAEQLSFLLETVGQTIGTVSETDAIEETTGIPLAVYHQNTIAHVAALAASPDGAKWKAVKRGD
eukprot:TRINITY_DN12170_c0_g1_i1.p1 TRINITY_DN12170_c0_g1~~TRINITY_DN12170_c0_g1_i1.p1  ORF type:complete len:853 (+),score=245.41 TRINITY_DN12170_c0_g1_i1:157-2715(+)